MNFTRIVRIASQVVSEGLHILCDMPSSYGGSHGGYFCCAGIMDGRARLICQIGPIRLEKKAEKYLFLAQEKARRLATRPDHVTSYQSRKAEEDKWGGAIRGTSWSFSFSGFPELMDEAVALVTAVCVEDLTEREAQAIADISKNPYFEQLLGRMQNIP